MQGKQLGRIAGIAMLIGSPFLVVGALANIDFKASQSMIRWIADTHPEYSEENLSTGTKIYRTGYNLGVRGFWWGLGVSTTAYIGSALFFSKELLTTKGKKQLIKKLQDQVELEEAAGTYTEELERLKAKT